MSLLIKTRFFRFFQNLKTFCVTLFHKRPQKNQPNHLETINRLKSKQILKQLQGSHVTFSLVYVLLHSTVPHPIIFYVSICYLIKINPCFSTLHRVSNLITLPFIAISEVISYNHHEKRISGFLNKKKCVDLGS